MNKQTNVENLVSSSSTGRAQPPAHRGAAGPTGLHRGTAQRNSGVGASTCRTIWLVWRARPGRLASESYYNLYSLKTDALSGMAKEMPWRRRRPARPASEQDLCDFDRKVLAHLHHGRRPDQGLPHAGKEIPRAAPPRAWPLIQSRRALHGKRVNEILSKFNDDTRRLRAGWWTSATWREREARQVWRWTKSEVSYFL